MKEYIQRWKANIAAHISNQPIYELCTVEAKIPGSRRFMRWWYQDMVQEVEYPRE